MHLKDYYQILELAPSATITDIKKAYRRLALIHHPDKNSGDAYSATQFAAIKEAYEVLSNPIKKEYYLQRRWYEQSIGKKTKQQTVTPANIIHQCVELDKHVAGIDIFRMDKAGLKDYVLQLLSNDNIEQLHHFNDETANKSIIELIISCIQPLPLNYTPEICTQLRALAKNNITQLGTINNFEKRIINKHKTQKYTLLFVIIITILLCLLILLAGR